MEWNSFIPAASPEWSVGGAEIKTLIALQALQLPDALPESELVPRPDEQEADATVLELLPVDGI